MMHWRANPRKGGLPTIIICAAILLGLAQHAKAFSLLPDPRTGTPQGDLEIAARWSPEPDPFGLGTGFHDGLQVAVAADFAERLQVTDPADVALVQQVIRQAFEAWETPDLKMDIDFSRVPVEGAAAGYEIDLFAVPASHPAFDNLNYYGVTHPRWRSTTNRLLSNGTRTDGLVITGVDIFINVDLVLQLGSLLPRDRQAQALQRLLMHEIGHGLGLGHPNTYNTFNANYDLDMDPYNPMNLDPLHPFDDLIFSENRNARAIMSNDRTQIGPFLFYTELQNDDRGGRDALYPSLLSCAADCSGNGRVDVAELIIAVNIALEQASLDTCIKADRDGDGMVSVDELIQGVITVLDGC